MPHRIREEIDRELAEAMEIAREARSEAMPWLYWAIAASFYLYEFLQELLQVLWKEPCKMNLH